MVAARILLVDDFKPWRILASSILKALPGLQIIGEACDGLEAIEETARLLPDIVLIDIGMPHLNGLEAARKIKQARPESKILFVTEQDDEDLRRVAFATGAEGYIVKSRAAAELPRALEIVAGAARENWVPSPCPPATLSCP